MDFLERGEVKIAADPREQMKYEDTMTDDELDVYLRKLANFYRRHPMIEREDIRRRNAICGYADEPRVIPPETK